MFAIAVLATLATLPPPAGDTEGVAAAARAVLKKHCAACHVGPGSENGYRFDALDAASMLKAYGPDEPAVLAPRDLGSRVYARAAVEKTMPPRATKERPSQAELDALKRWVEAGTPAFPAPPARPHLGVASQLDAVAAHLAAAEAGRRPFLRYFTLTHLHNDTAVGEDDLRTARAALAKAVNSLSRLPLVALAAVDPDQTVFALDLRDVGWQDFRAWRAVLKQYPYGLHYRGGDDAGLRAAQERLDGLSGGGLVAVRADWFVATATWPPLYETLLRVPDTAAALRAELGIDLAKNFRENTLRRAGLLASGVSGQNRLVERQDSPSGYYWESYDFKPRRARGSLARFPLGPAFPGNEFPKQAFAHDGGEVIFALPNGLQGYLLVDAAGRRIDAGPIDVVSDSLKTSGTPAIVNGLSCIHCHKHGTIPFADAIREGHALSGDARDKVRALYPEPAAMARLVAADGERFVRALERVTGPYLKVGPDAAKPIRDFAEPVGEVARGYLLKDISLEKAAAELGLAGPADLAARLRADPALKELGVLALLHGQAVKRDDWEAVDASASLFQEVALALRLGTPVRNR